MELPNPCKEALSALAAHADLAAMKKSAARMTERYREESGHGVRLVTTDTEVLTYAAVRMPATYGAVQTALTSGLACLPEQTAASIHTVLDLGAGTGAGMWAAEETLPFVSEMVCVEREPAMIRIGKQLSAQASFAPHVTWVQADAETAAAKLSAQGKTFDLVMASYMTNEMEASARRHLLSLLFSLTGQVLLITEPGTPVGFSILREAEKQLRGEGALPAAPCPATDRCPLAENDWCHFTCRVARSRLHKLLKGGEVPYEDEKFSYLCLARQAVQPCTARILRHPITEPGRITLKLCTSGGTETRCITKREKPVFAAARKAECGDIWPYEGKASSASAVRESFQKRK